MAAMWGPSMDLADWQTGFTAPPPRFAALSASDAQGGRASAELASHVALLTKAIETEVIPRLLQARSNNSAAEIQRQAASWQPDIAEIRDFTWLVLDRDTTLAPIYLQALVDRGVRVETLFRALLAGAAHMLGTLWEEDEVDFTVVTTGVWRIQMMMRALSASSLTHVAPQAHRILLVPAIGEQHCFGLSMVSEFFVRAGWDVTSDRFDDNLQLAEALRGSWFDVLGFSVGGHDRLDILAKSIKISRCASRNLQLGVMVGGPVFVAHPELVSQVGADATAADAAQATVEAEGLMAMLARTG